MSPRQSPQCRSAEPQRESPVWKKDINNIVIVTHRTRLHEVLGQISPVKSISQFETYHLGDMALLQQICGLVSITKWNECPPLQNLLPLACGLFHIVLFCFFSIHLGVKKIYFHNHFYIDISFETKSLRQVENKIYLANKLVHKLRMTIILD